MLDRQLAGREYICDDYSIADIACWPWILTYKRQEIAVDEFPNVRRWHETMKSRPGVRRGYDVGKELLELSARGPDAEAREQLFPGSARR